MNSPALHKGNKTPKEREILTVEEYRKLMDDYISTDEIIRKRVKYMETLCRFTVRDNLQKYVKSKKNEDQNPSHSRKD